MRIPCSVPLFIAGLLISGQLLAANQSAQDFARAKVDQIVARIEAERSMLEADPEKILDLVDELVLSDFDFVRMSKWVLGKTHWNAADQTQRQEFINQFKILLIRTYSNALLEYSGQQINFLPTEQGPRPNLAIVKTEFVLEGGRTLPIDYRMYSKDDQWKIIDVSVDGVSLVSTYRGSFASEISKHGLDMLISKLSERNARPVGVQTQ